MHLEALIQTCQMHKEELKTLFLRGKIQNLLEQYAEHYLTTTLLTTDRPLLRY